MLKIITSVIYILAAGIIMGVSSCATTNALGGDAATGSVQTYSMYSGCEVDTIEDIVMPSGAIVISVLNVTAVDEPSDGGDGFDLNKPMLQWAQSTGRFLNVTCEEPEILIFYMEV